MNGQTEVLQPTAGELIEFGSFRHPETVLKEAELVAQTFARRAERLQLYKTIGNSKHLLIEGWQTLGAMYRVTAGVVEDHYIQIGDAHGYEATAEAIYVPTAQRISTAKAMCLSDEENWGLRPKYEWRDKQGGGREKVKVSDTPTPLQQIRSMAQTRACSKVLANLLKWVARMGGYAGTPAEEMTGDEPSVEKSVRQPQAKPAGNGGVRVISENQVKRLFAIAKQGNVSTERLRNYLHSLGIESPDAIPVSQYDMICAAVAAGLNAQTQSG